MLVRTVPTLSHVVRRCNISLTKHGCVTGIFANLFNVVANMYYIDWFGFPGASMATSTTRFVQCFLLAGYIVWRKPHKRYVAAQSVHTHSYFMSAFHVSMH